MNWQKTYKRLQKMVGMKLHSISGKADIALQTVDQKHITVSAKTKAGKTKTMHRSTKELQGLVSKMKSCVPIHVDSEIHGSGSSRNQPETILANMPDVEWLRVDGRKHIMWVGKNSHKAGTLCKHQ